MYLFIENNYFTQGYGNITVPMSGLHYSFNDANATKDDVEFVYEHLSENFYNLTKNLFKKDDDKVSISVVESKYCGNQRYQNQRYYIGLSILDLREKESENFVVSRLMSKMISEANSYGFKFSRQYHVGGMQLNGLVDSVSSDQREHYQTNVLIS